MQLIYGPSVRAYFFAKSTSIPLPVTNTTERNERTRSEEQDIELMFDDVMDFSCRYCAALL